MLKPPPGTPGKAWPAICVGLFVAFGGKFSCWRTGCCSELNILLGVLFGYDTVRQALS